MSTSCPKISIITPSYNQGKFIEETILSVIGQGYPNLEYIIIDGGSTDETIDIIKKYEANITYWISEKDSGQSNAINKGFLKATGDIVAWLNSDDMYMPNCLTKVSSLLPIDEPSVLFGNCIHFKESGDDFISWGSDVVNYSKAATLENVDFISQSSSFFTMKAWSKAGNVDENLYYTLDWEWFLRAKNKDVQFLTTAACLSLYRLHESHKSGVGGKKRQLEVLDVYKKYSKRYSALYQMLINENFDTLNFKGRIKRKKHKLLNKPFSKIDHLRINSAKLYKDYTDEEIKFCMNMM